MIAHQIDPMDVQEIKRIIEALFATNTSNSDGTRRPILKPEEAAAIVDKVISELGRRGLLCREAKVKQWGQDQHLAFSSAVSSELLLSLGHYWPGLFWCINRQL
jgi:hypothetical protein